MVVGRAGTRDRCRDRRVRRARGADAARPEAAARLSHRREHRHHLHRVGACAGVPRQRHGFRRGARLHRSASARAEPFGVQKPAFLRLRRSAHRDRRTRHGASRRLDPPHAANRVLFLVGAAAISALPPLNGFVSEWLTFQAILLSPAVPQWGVRLLAPMAGAALALAAALAAACFVKAFGVTFLGRARSARAERASETDRFSLAAMFAFAAPCLFLGILPGLAIDWISPAAEEIVHGQMPSQHLLAWLTIVPIAQGRSSYNGLLVFLFITTSACLAVAAMHRFASHVVRRGPAWDCGTPNTDALMQYTAASFAQPIRRVFGTVVFRAREPVRMPAPGGAGAAQ